MSHQSAVVVSIVASLTLFLTSAARAQTPPDGTAPSMQQPPTQPTAAPQAAAPTPVPAPAPKTESKAAAAPTDGNHKPSATDAIVIGLNTLEGVISKSVRSATGNEDMGRIVDVLIDGGGQTRAAVIDFGGFLGVGSRKVAVDWKALDFADSIKSGTVKVSLSRDQVRQSPEYKVGEPVVVLEGAKAANAAPPQNRPDSATAH